MQRRSAEVPRRRGKLLGLLALNAGLVLALGLVTFGPTAEAQPRVRGSYTMAAGDVNGAQASAVYVVDTVNQEVMAVLYDPSEKKLSGLGYRSLALDTAAVLRGGASR